MATFTLLCKIDLAYAGVNGRGWDSHVGPPPYYTLKIDNDGLVPPNGGKFNWSFADGTLTISGYTGIEPFLPPPGFVPTTNLQGRLVSLTLPTGSETIQYDTLIATNIPNSGFPSTFFNFNIPLANFTSYFLLTGGGVITAASIYSYATNLDVDAIWHGVTGIVRITGNYTILSWSWRIASGTEFTIPGITPPQLGYLFTQNGRQFSIASGGGTSGNIDNIYYDGNLLGTGPDLKGVLPGGGSGIKSVTFLWGSGSATVLAADYDEWTSIFISFELPGTLPEDDVVVIVNSDGFPPIDGGTQFSGSVVLGTIKILTTQASGIYKIVADQTHDVVYTDNPNSNTTTNFAIPNPHIKTGFIGG